jgi:hypothetical protein
LLFLQQLVQYRPDLVVEDRLPAAVLLQDLLPPRVPRRLARFGPLPLLFNLFLSTLALNLCLTGLRLAGLVGVENRVRFLPLRLSMTEKEKKKSRRREAVGGRRDTWIEGEKR